MELDAEHGPVRHDGREPLAVLRGPHDDRRVGGARGERMDVVERAAASGKSRGEWRSPLESDLAPADVRDAPAVRPQPADDPLDQPEPVRLAELVRALEQQLHSEADPE